MVKYVCILVLSLFSTVWAVDFTAHLKGAPVSDEAISQSWDIREGNNEMFQQFLRDMPQQSREQIIKQREQNTAAIRFGYIAYWYGYNQGIVTSLLRDMENEF